MPSRARASPSRTRSLFSSVLVPRLLVLPSRFASSLSRVVFRNLMLESCFGSWIQRYVVPCVINRTNANSLLQGMVANDRGDTLQEHKIYFSRDDNDGQQFKSLEEVVDYVKPTALMGLSTIGGAFTELIIRKMASYNERPIIFPLSNPSSKSECTYEQAMQWTNNKVIFASGSPFPDFEADGRVYTPGQGRRNSLVDISQVWLLTSLQEITCMSSLASDSALSCARLCTSPRRWSTRLLSGWPNLSRMRNVRRAGSTPTLTESGRFLSSSLAPSFVLLRKRTSTRTKPCSGSTIWNSTTTSAPRCTIPPVIIPDRQVPPWRSTASQPSFQICKLGFVWGRWIA